MRATVAFVFEKSSFLKSSDWLSLLSPLGVYIIEITSLADAYKTIFKRFMLWAHSLMAHEVRATVLEQAERDGPCILSTMESLLPLYAHTIIQHILLHLCSSIRRFGPLHCSHMCSPPTSASPLLIGLACIADTAL